jgi:NHL repeat-containing protein
MDLGLTGKIGIFLVLIILVGSVSSGSFVYGAGGGRAEQYVFMTKWGSVGTTNGQFKEAGGIGVDALGHIYVVDRGNDRIQKFDSNGTFITAWGSLGTSNGQFNKVTDVTVGLAGHVYVSDYGNNNIQVFGLGTNPHPAS